MMLKIYTYFFLFVFILSGCGIFVKKKPSMTKEEMEIVAENYVSTGTDYFAQKEFDKAIEEWKKALEYIPEDAEVHNFLGIAYHRVGHLDSSISEYKKAVQLDPDYHQALNNTGYIYFLKGEYKTALQYFDRALHVNPSYQQAILNRQKCLDIMEGDLKIAAFELFESANKLDSLELKIQNYKNALKIDSNYVDAWNNLGVSYHYYGYIDSAVYCLKKALEINPEHPQVNNNIAYLLDSAGEYDAAIHHYQKAIIAKPDYAIAMVNLGDTYYDQQDYDSAKTMWESALKLYPNDTTIKEKLNKLPHPAGGNK
jgi:Tfp pilus assembly protein PilF